MRQTVVGVYDNYADACSAQRALIDAGFPQADISIYAQSTGTSSGGGPRVYAPDGGGVRHEKPVFDHLEQLFARLFKRGAYPPETEDYREVIRRGGAILSADVPEVQVDLACDVMRRCGAADIEERAKAWRSDTGARAEDALKGGGSTDERSWTETGAQSAREGGGTSIGAGTAGGTSIEAGAGGATSFGAGTGGATSVGAGTGGATSFGAGIGGATSMGAGTTGQRTGASEPGSGMTRVEQRTSDEAAMPTGDIPVTGAADSTQGSALSSATDAMAGSMQDLPGNEGYATGRAAENDMPQNQKASGAEYKRGSIHAATEDSLRSGATSQHDPEKEFRAEETPTTGGTSDTVTGSPRGIGDTSDSVTGSPRGTGGAGDTVTGNPPGDERDADDDAFRRDYDARYANTGAPYEEFRRAYAHGATHARDERYRGSDWKEAEPRVREQWEAQHPESAWERFKAAVRHGWERVTER